MLSILHKRNNIACSDFKVHAEVMYVCLQIRRQVVRDSDRSHLPPFTTPTRGQHHHVALYPTCGDTCSSFSPVHFAT